LPQDDPKQRRPDISKAKRLLGWEPKIDLEHGLKLSLEYFRQAVAEAIAKTGATKKEQRA
jgi:dTDP-glucose 4,6-dehydratase